MASETHDLWPEDLATSTVVPPVAILREQAAALARRTNGLIEGEVLSRPERHRPSDPAYHPFVHEFWFRAPAFDDYRCQLLDVLHGFDLYPVVVRYKLGPEREVHAETEDRFKEVLAGLFSDAKTREVIGALLSQIEK